MINITGSTASPPLPRPITRPAFDLPAPVPHNRAVITPTPPVPGRTLPNPLPSWLHVSDLQGLAQLATRGVLGVADVAESVHGNVYRAVAAPFGRAGAANDAARGRAGGATGGITGLVYGSVRGLTRLTGGVVDRVLAGAGPLLARKASSPPREAMLAVLNGVLGDQLLETANPLAIRMSLRHQGQSLQFDKASIAARFPEATGKVLVLLHGLCMNDLQWTHSDGEGKQDYAQTLARECGYTPVYLHYNTGRHVSDNGQQCAALLEQLLGAWPQPVEDLTLLAHSMGGLVARSACHQAELSGMTWRGQLKSLVFLGTPHHGAPLERVGSLVDGLLGSNVVTRPFAAIGHIRSAGITDLRYGYVVPADWQHADRFARTPDARTPLPLPAGVACYAVAGVSGAADAAAPGDGVRAAWTQTAKTAKDALWGDGLVPVGSAFGEHAESARVLAFAPDRRWLAHGTHHLGLLKSPAVAAQLVRWLGPDPARP